MAVIEHRVELHDRHAHQFAVTLTVPNPAQRQRLSLPVWIPGSYMIREFSRHVLGLQARQGRAPRVVRQLDKSSWEVVCDPSAALVVTLIVYGFDHSVRTAFLDTQRGFFNGTSLCLQVDGQTANPQALVIGRLPRGWQAATAMRPDRVDARGIGRYVAADYEELVDHPFELGTFWSARFRAGGVDHRFVVSGAWPDVDTERLVADAQRICETEIGFWHPPRSSPDAGAGRPRRRATERAPFDHYLFLLNAVDDGYGGLEHRASTALLAARRDLPHKPLAGVDAATEGAPDAKLDAKASAKLSARVGTQLATRHGAKSLLRPELSDGYVTLLGLISHEYFHSWNVKRLKPAEFASLDLSRENHTELLWFFEGFTSYYDDLLLLRAGLIDAARYVKLVAKTVSGVLATPGRHVQSLAQASMDAWIKYYRADENTPNATVSYYAKGSLVGLAADLVLRRSGGSLDGAMRRLWAESGGGPIDQAQIAAALSAEAGEPMADRLASWVHGRDDLPLRELLADFAISWQQRPGSWAQRIGLRAGEANGVVRISHVLHGGWAEQAGLAAGDEWMAVNDWRLRRLDDLPRLVGDARAATALVARDQRLLRLPLPSLADCTPVGATVTLGLVSTEPAANAEALARRRSWLGA